jgi:1-acyl-sn-glycerol-3-phosphate acyltransferase
MLNFLPKPLIALISFMLLLINTCVWTIPIYTLALLKLIPIKAFRQKVDAFLPSFAEHWISCNQIWMKLTQKTHWDVQGDTDLDYNGWYLVNSNHRSWVDILVVQKVFNKRIPLLKFFAKEELKYLPLFGTAWWALDYPFMKRYTKEYLEKHPEKRGQDIETTKKLCKKFSLTPTSVANFLEGTRFTQAKHDKQQSPFKHLLKPKSGGIAFALNVMGEKFQSMLDVTIVYPEGTPSFWDFLSGKMHRVIVRTRKLRIPNRFIHGDYINDPDFREDFQQWVSELWREKDELIEQLLALQQTKSKPF